MENASKALIIAGAILLSILIIALGIYVFNMARGVTDTNQLSELEVSQFNQKFTNYGGKQLGGTVKDLLGILASNATANKDADEKLPDVVYLDKRSTIDLRPIPDATGSGGATIKRTDGDKNNFVVSLASGETGTKIKNLIETDIIDSTTYSSYQSHWAIVSDRETQSVAMFNRCKSIIADKHTYQVYIHNDNNSGLVDYVVIVY